MLIDTHIWIWWTNGSPELRPAEIQVLEEAFRGDQLYLSAFSVWEVALGVSVGRLTLGEPVREWVTRSIDDLNLRVVSVDTRVAIEANSLPGPFHRDPADRIIVSTARILQTPLFTRDSAILAYPHVQLLHVP